MVRFGLIFMITVPHKGVEMRLVDSLGRMNRVGYRKIYLAAKRMQLTGLFPDRDEVVHAFVANRRTKERKTKQHKVP